VELCVRVLPGQGEDRRAQPLRVSAGSVSLSLFLYPSFLSAASLSLSRSLSLYRAN
jgi:hypothetical protein